nr:MAG TPA: hypothetical protein [Caudoviricetes sp.]
MQQIRIDFDNPGLPQSLGAVEGESQSRIFQAALYKSGAAYTAPAGAVYSIMYRGFGPQNQGWYDTLEDGAGKRAACTVSGNVVTCELARQALRVPGHLTVVLCLTDAKGYMLKSWPIMADVRNDGYEDTGESEMYFNLSGIAGNYLAQLEKAMADAETTRNNLISTSAQAKKDIDAKAAAALKSIPESYTELDGSVKQIQKELSDTSRGMILQVSTDENTSYSVDDIDQDYVVKVSPANAGVSISEIDQSGTQITHKFYSYVSKSGLYRLTPYSSSPIAKLRFTDMTEKVSISVYFPNDKKNLATFFPSQFRPKGIIQERNTISGYRINATSKKLDVVETGKITFYDVSGCDYIQISPFKFYGKYGCAFFALNGFSGNVSVSTDKLKIIDAIETSTFDEKILQVPDGCNFFGITWLDENSYSPKVVNLLFSEKKDENLTDFYGIFKNFSSQNGYSSLSVTANSAKSTALTAPTLKKLTKNGIAYGHMGQIIIKNGMCYATFLQNSGTDGEAPYSETSELILAKFLLSDILSDNFSPDTKTEVKIIGKLGSTCAGHTAKSIYKDNAMCLIGSKIYITFMFISEVDSDAHLFRKVYDTSTDAFEDDAVCDLEYNGKLYPFTNSTINMIYEKNQLNQNASGIMEIVSKWNEYNSEYYATGINGEKPNNGFIIKTSDFKTFYFVSALPFNDDGIAEIASIVSGDKLYVACRQDYGVPYLLLNSYNLKSKKWGTAYRIQDGNVRPWFFFKNDKLYLINTIEEYYRRYTNISNVLTSGYVGASSPVKLVATLKNCGTYLATAEYNQNTYYVCTYKGTIYFGTLNLCEYDESEINEKFLALLDS